MPRGGISHSTTGYPTHRQGSYGLATPVQKSMSVQKSSPTIPEIRFSASSPLNSPGRVVSPVQLDASSSNEKLSAGSPLTSTISNQPPVILQSNKARQQIQNDVQTAAALAALQNVKNQTVVILSYLISRSRKKEIPTLLPVLLDAKNKPSQNVKVSRIFY